VAGRLKTDLCLEIQLILVVLPSEEGPVFPAEQIPAQGEFKVVEGAIDHLREEGGLKEWNPHPCHRVIAQVITRFLGEGGDLRLVVQEISEIVWIKIVRWVESVRFTPGHPLLAHLDIQFLEQKRADLDKGFPKQVVEGVVAFELTIKGSVVSPTSPSRNCTRRIITFAKRIIRILNKIL
jgi:hypothetical protein